MWTFQSITHHILSLKIRRILFHGWTSKILHINMIGAITLPQRWELWTSYSSLSLEIASYFQLNTSIQNDIFLPNYLKKEKSHIFAWLWVAPAILSIYVILREMESRKKITFPTRYFGPPVKLVDFFRGPKLLKEDQPSPSELEIIGNTNQSFENPEQVTVIINQITCDGNDPMAKNPSQGKHD